jgi:hypothetical protein
MKSIILFSLLTFSGAVLAADEQAYCDFAHEQAEAEKIQFQSPRAISALGRASTGTSNTLGVGLSESLSGYLKSRMSLGIGDGQCRLYHDVNEITKHVQYDIIDLTTRELENQIRVIDQQIDVLLRLSVDEQARVAVKSSTIVTVATIEAAIAKLRVQKAEDLEQVKGVILPPISPTPLREILADASITEQTVEQAKIDQSKYNNWDVSVAAGVGTNPSRGILSTPDKPFIGLNFSYSLGAARANRALDKSAASYVEWTKDQSIGSIHLGQLLKAQVEAVRNANIGSLSSYSDYQKILEDNLKTTESVDTPDAHRFHVQVLIELSSLLVETETRRDSINVMTKYLAQNFGEEYESR